jgi:hypothetical protein
MENALAILASLASYDPDALKPTLAAGLHAALAACLNPPCSIDVQVGCCGEDDNVQHIA